MDNFLSDRAAMDKYLSDIYSDNSQVISLFKMKFREAMNNILTNRQRECLCLFWVDGLNKKQIALKLGIDRSAVSRHIKRGSEKLYKVLYYNLYFNPPQ